MYDRNEHVTLDSLLDVLRANPGPNTASIFEGGRTTLYKLLHDIGFSWQKTNGRKVLMEDVNVAAKRIVLLREYRKLAAENNNVAFLDETWTFSQGYKINEMVRECGHQVLRLPPYHCQYNPIQLVWANCKGYYKKHTGRNNKFDDAAVRALWQ
uniref:Uncharacterized protein n=1 Tax=Timema cristinae TaxID=61476 RepID=A0A7R9DNL0_TIMCR|nr:unnamed protein product [Timema cristinae]